VTEILGGVSFEREGEQVTLNTNTLPQTKVSIANRKTLSTPHSLAAHGLARVESADNGGRKLASGSIARVIQKNTRWLG